MAAQVGSIEVLQGFHHVFDLASVFLKGKLKDRAATTAVPQVDCFCACFVVVLSVCSEFVLV